MKNIFIIFLLALYLTITVGLNIIVHTCGGESDTMLATTTTEDPCGCGDEMPTDKCCTTELTTVQLEDAQQVSITTIIQPLIASDVVMPGMSFVQLLHDSNITSAFLTFFSPPPNNDLSITNSVFRI
ncbi:MAG: hypothetical protein WDA22_13740 [Bacteroidota bacterium]